MPKARIFAAGIFLIVFIGLIYLSLDFMKIMKNTDLSGYEGFSQGPARASDCQCLPGYIPSKKRSKFGGRFVAVDNGWGINFLPDGTKNAHWVRTCGMCNMNLCDRKIANPMTALEFTQKYVLQRNNIFECSMLTSTDDSYFCQNMSNKRDTRKCY